MNEIVGLIATTTKLASKIGVGTIISGVIEKSVEVAELSAFKKTCCAAASLTLTGAASMAADKYIDVTAEKANNFIEDIKSRMKAKEDEVKIETIIVEETTEEVKEEKPKKKGSKKTKTIEEAKKELEKAKKEADKEDEKIRQTMKAAEKLCEE